MQRALVGLNWSGQLEAIVHPFYCWKLEVGGERGKVGEETTHECRRITEKTMQALDTRCVSEATADVRRPESQSQQQSISCLPAYIILSVPLLVGAHLWPSRTNLICRFSAVGRQFKNPLQFCNMFDRMLELLWAKRGSEKNKRKKPSLWLRTTLLSMWAYQKSLQFTKGLQEHSPTWMEVMEKRKRVRNIHEVCRNEDIWDSSGLKHSGQQKWRWRERRRKRQN